MRSLLGNLWTLTLTLVLAVSVPARATEADIAARLLAGLPPTEGEPATKARGVAYQGYAREMTAAWGRYDARTLAPLRAFVAEQLADVALPVVFYPFAGPDIVNAVTVFPKARTYVLLGLEPVGEVPAPQRDPAAKVLGGVKRLRTSIDKLLGLNFFRTQSMKAELKQDSYTGVGALMMFFLARTGHTIESARGVRFDASGEVTDALGKPFTGLEIVFRAPGDAPENPRRVLYFSGDLSDTAFEQRAGLREFLRKSAPVATLLKAASYLMYGSAFDDVRNTILGRSGVIVQEASGMPYRFLRNNPTWKVSLYGHYDKPIDLFATRCQPDLALDMKSQKPGRFDFSFGYEFRAGEGHLIVARRSPDAPLQEPVLDMSYQHGEATRCAKDRLVLTTCVQGRCSVRFE